MSADMSLLFIYEDCMKFITQLWEQNTSIYEKILSHPFNKELLDGSLDKTIFSYYIEQDSLYLHYFSKALAIIATKLDDGDEYLQFLQFSLDAIVVERTLLHGYFTDIFNIKWTHRLTTATLGYTSELITTAYQKPIEIAIAYIAPCFWIYSEVGKYTLLHVAENNIYRQWIDTYASEEFAITVTTILEILERFANNTTPTIRKAMEISFSHAFLWEYRFWNDAYRLDDFALI